MNRRKIVANILLEKNLNGKWIASGTIYPENLLQGDSVFCESIGVEYDSVDEAKNVVIEFCSKSYSMKKDEIEFEIR